MLNFKQLLEKNWFINFRDFVCLWLVYWYIVRCMSNLRSSLPLDFQWLPSHIGVNGLWPDLSYFSGNLFAKIHLEGVNSRGLLATACSRGGSLGVLKYTSEVSITIYNLTRTSLFEVFCQQFNWIIHLFSKFNSWFLWFYHHFFIVSRIEVNSMTIFNQFLDKYHTAVLTSCYGWLAWRNWSNWSLWKLSFFSTCNSFGSSCDHTFSLVGEPTCSVFIVWHFGLGFCNRVPLSVGSRWFLDITFHKWDHHSHMGINDLLLLFVPLFFIQRESSCSAELMLVVHFPPVLKLLDILWNQIVDWPHTLWVLPPQGFFALLV